MADPEFGGGGGGGGGEVSICVYLQIFKYQFRPNFSEEIQLRGGRGWLANPSPSMPPLIRSQGAKLNTLAKMTHYERYLVCIPSGYIVIILTSQYLWKFHSLFSYLTGSLLLLLPSPLPPPPQLDPAGPLEEACSTLNTLSLLA